MSRKERGGVSHSIQIAQLLHTLSHHPLHFGILAHVGEGDGGFAPHCLNFAANLMGTGVVGGDIVYADVIAILGETKGNSFADATRGACDDTAFEMGRGGGEAAWLDGDTGEVEGTGGREGAGEWWHAKRLCSLQVEGLRVENIRRAKKREG